MSTQLSPSNYIVYLPDSLCVADKPKQSLCNKQFYIFRHSVGIISFLTDSHSPHNHPHMGGMKPKHQVLITNWKKEFQIKHYIKRRKKKKKKIPWPFIHSWIPSHMGYYLSNIGLSRMIYLDMFFWVIDYLGNRVSHMLSGNLHFLFASSVIWQ